VKTTLVILVVLTAAVLGGAFLFGPGMIGGGLSMGSSGATGTEVRIQTVVHSTLTQTVKAPGMIEPHTKVDISAEVAARIVQLPFREGDRVHKGDVIVKLDDRDLKAVLDAAIARADGEKFRLESEEASLVGLNSNLAFAKRELERRQNLLSTGDVATKEVEDVQDRVLALESSVEAAKHTMSVVESSLASAKADIDRAQETLRKTTITAPMDGIITILNAEIGEVVLMGTMNNPGTVIMTIADLGRMIMKAEVAESDIALVKVGQRCTVRINAYRDEPFSGTVARIALQRTTPAMSAADGGGIGGGGYFEVEVEIDLQGRQILSGGLANVDIEVQSHDGLIVESQAVVDRPVEELPEHIRRQDPLVDLARKTTPVVYCMVNGKAICTPVKVGPSDLTRSVITAGIEEGDVVITGPYKVLEKLKHDEAVQDIAAKLAREDGKSSASDNMMQTAASQPVNDVPATQPVESTRASTNEAAAGGIR